jgi:hypothetical protein
MPLNSTLHVDELLSQVSVSYEPQGLIGFRIFPIVPVKTDTNLFRVYERNWRIPETRRANKAIAREHDFAISTSSYSLKKHALKSYISDDDKDNYDISDLRADTTKNLTQAIALRMEKDVADIFTTTSWSQNISLGASGQWDTNTTTTNPIPVMDTAVSTVLKQSGYMPNFAWIPRDAFVAAKNHVSILDRIKYTSREMTEGMLAALFGINDLMLANAMYDSSDEGRTSTVAAIWPKHAFVGYKPGSAGPLQPSSGYIFQKATPAVKRWYVDEREAEAIEVTKKYDVKVVASLSGCLITSILA